MSAQCTSTPLSWLRLEQHALGELEGDVAHETTAHLEVCAACRARIAAIHADDVTLRPLDAASTKAPAAAVVAPFRPRATWVASLALAAALLLAVGPMRQWWGLGGAPGSSGEEPTVGARAKGEEVAMRLVRDDGVELPAEDASYEPGARLKVLVTCPPTLRAAWDVAVYEEGEAIFPMDRVESLACANDAPLPGAFRLTGRSPVTVCVVWSTEGAPDRAAVAAEPPSDRAADRRCLHLAPALAP